MGFKEHVGIRVATYFTNLLRSNDDLRNITNQQIDKLSISKDEIILKLRFFKSFNRKEVHSAIFTSEKIVIVPCKQEWKPEEIVSVNKENIENYKTEKGKLFGSALRIKKIADILKLEINEKNSSSHKLQIVVDSWEFGEKLTTGIKTFFERSTGERASNQETTSLPVEYEKKNGAIILWDYDNVKLTNKGKIKDDPIGARIFRELNSYQPVIKGICAYVEPLSKVERSKIDEIDKNIEAYQPPIGKDAADYLLLQKGKDLISLHNPETLIIISGDHIFTNLLEFQKESDIKVVLFHIGNISRDWLSAEVNIKGINLSKQDNLKCPNTGCTQVFETQRLMDQHTNANHSKKSGKNVICKDVKCNNKFAKKVHMERHYQDKHAKKV